MTSPIAPEITAKNPRGFEKWFNRQKGAPGPGTLASFEKDGHSFFLKQLLQGTTYPSRYCGYPDKEETEKDRQRWIDLATAEAIRPPSAWLHVQFEPRHPLPLVPCAGWIVRSSDDGMRDIYAVWWQDKMAPDIEKIAAFPWQNAQAWEL